MRFYEILGESGALMSSDGEQLPSVVYHGTRLSMWEQHISKEGLKPFKATDQKRAFVFLSWAEYGAARYAKNDVARFEEGEVGVILAVSLTPEIAGKIFSRKGEFLRCQVAIPVNQIKVARIINGD